MQTEGGYKVTVSTQMHPERLVSQSVFMECLNQTVVLLVWESWQVKLRDVQRVIPSSLM